MGPTWGPSEADRTQVGPMLAPWTLLSGETTTTVTGHYPPGHYPPGQSPPLHYLPRALPTRYNQSIPIKLVKKSTKLKKTNNNGKVFKEHITLFPFYVILLIKIVLPGENIYLIATCITKPVCIVIKQLCCITWDICIINKIIIIDILALILIPSCIAIVTCKITVK